MCIKIIAAMVIFVCILILIRVVYDLLSSCWYNFKSEMNNTESDPDEEIVFLDVGKFDASTEVKQLLMLLVYQVTAYPGTLQPDNIYKVKIKRRALNYYPFLKQFIIDDTPKQ